MARPRPAHWVLTVSALALIAIPIVAAAGSGSSSAPQPLGERPTLSTEAAPTVPAPRIGTPVLTSAPATGVAPTSVDIADLGVSAQVDPVGVEESGWVEIPEDVNRVGWYRFGTGIGTEQGSTVIVGHRDGYNQGAGAFYSVGALAPGDSFTISGEDGREYSYEVVAREVFNRSELPVDEIFRESGTPVVTLISCTGYFDRDQGGYRENVVVTAVPRGVQPKETPATSRVGPI